MSSNFSFQDLLVISAVASLVTIVTILCWGLCARYCGRCRRTVAHSSTAAQVTSTPVRYIEDSMEMAAFTPISISGPLVQSPILAPPVQAQGVRKSGRKTKKPDFYTSCPHITDLQWLFVYFCNSSYLILVDQTSQIDGSYVFTLFSKYAPLARHFVVCRWTHSRVLSISAVLASYVGIGRF